MEYRLKSKFNFILRTLKFSFKLRFTDDKIRHRINSIHELKEVNQYKVKQIYEAGSEIINHEPFLSGDLFKEWIKFYRHKFLILNVKEEGLEKDLIDLMAL